MKKIQFSSLLFTILLLLSCNNGKGLFEKEDLETKYKKAVQDARFAEASEISNELTRITPHNKELNYDQEGNVLFVTWTSWDGYKNALGKTLELERDVWVSVIPDLKNFCHQFGFKHYIDARLEQLLGLPPGRGYTQMVEFYAKPQDVFRPCPDPEITDGECELDFPYSPYIQINEQHKTWINEHKATSYEGDKTHPWTRLGYTYDWGNPSNHVGLSEFVVRKGATIKIRAVYSTLDYCKSK